MAIKKWQASLLFDAQLELGEGACWDSGIGRFLFVDIKGMSVGQIDPCTGSYQLVRMDQMVSAVIPLYRKKELLIALENSLELLNFQTGERNHLAEIEGNIIGNRCNDGKCDAAGRLWIGTMDKNAQSQAGALYRYDHSGLFKMLDKRTVSNGLGWSPDNRVMYYIDSRERQVKAFDFDLDKGIISNGRIIVEILEPGCVPDGMCVDAEGMLWVAIWGGAEVRRYHPLTGYLIGKVQVNAPYVTNCVFGGKDLNQLIITTARAPLTLDQLARYPLSGGLFVAHTQCEGLDSGRFVMGDV